MDKIATVRTKSIVNSQNRSNSWQEMAVLGVPDMLDLSKDSNQVGGHAGTAHRVRATLVFLKDGP
jgi:hypothetical protein